METGNLSIHSENIFPIIKKWLYSDHDIFVRELISNASDAITKLKKLVAMGEAQVEDEEVYRIDVTLDPEAKTLTFSDNGIGMTGDEIKQYINQIAFSGAEDFVAKYKGSTDGDQIIGHFGLGFYSAFMVASRVEIQSHSHRQGAKAVHWVNDGGTEFHMSDGTREKRGTDVILHLSEEGKDFSSVWKLRETIEKYCSFMPYPIYLHDLSTAKASDQDGDITRNGDTAGHDTERADTEIAEAPLNTTHPLYLSNASEVTDEQYKEFYRSTFRDFRDPLFQIHLNMDYPFRLKGILYFPKLGNDLELMDGQIKLYNSQVFVADNIKEVIPEFLMLLKGVIDCPDLPLNVSRSFLQNDGFVRKISGYISKKVSDKLLSLFRQERKTYESFWEDIHPFIKFGAIRDDKFREAIHDAILFRTDAGDYCTLSELKLRYDAQNSSSEETTENAITTIYYTNDPTKQAQYIRMLNNEGIESVVLDQMIDNALISMIEHRDEKLKFARVDSGIRTDGSKEQQPIEVDESITKLFPIPVKIRPFKNTEIPAMLITDEEKRRMGEMMRMYGMKDMAMPLDRSIVLNESNPVVQKLLEAARDGKEIDLIPEYLYKLAQLGNEPLTPDEQHELIDLSNRMLLKLLEL